MSATTTLNAHGRYKDHLKLMRAETAASWLAIVIDRLRAGTQSAAPATSTVDETAPPPRWYGAFY